jgi:cyclic pyranopterin phosphate synthase
MKDRLGRDINYIRVAVTDRCNLRCRYCMPPGGVAPKSHADILRYEEIEAVLRECADLGIGRIRLTGGEPLVRKGIVGFIERVSGIPGISGINLTTNGILLAEHAAGLKSAGVAGINISLDTLDPEKYAAFTCGGDLNAVLAGIDAAVRERFDQIKLNVVVMRGLNDGELDGFLDMIRDREIYLRFIELMPIGEAKKEEGRYVSTEEILRKLPPLVREEDRQGTGPAEYYRAEGYAGTIGFIHAMSRSFCADCNRLRLTADGKLMPCLHADTEIDLKPYLRPPDPEMIRQSIVRAIQAKPEKHGMKPAEEDSRNKRFMNQVGG